jgi:hypothetical protein
VIEFCPPERPMFGRAGIQKSEFRYLDSWRRPVRHLCGADLSAVFVAEGATSLTPNRNAANVQEKAGRETGRSSSARPNDRRLVGRDI